MDDGNPEILASSVSERDIDLLLLEEFVSSPAFAEWFMGLIGIADAVGVSVSRAQRSATILNGESDLEITLNYRGKYRLLIENKISTGFQPRQAERYRERGASYLNQAICQGVRTVLVAPERYFGGDAACKGFDAKVTYEVIQGWFANQSGLGGRARYKRRLLSAAIEKATYGWQLKEDEPTTRFWKRYWELACSIAPELELPEPTPKPSGSSFILFRPSKLPADVSLYHKVAYGNVDLQFARMAGRILELRTRYGQSLAKEMRIEKANKSAVIRVKVPPINMSDDPEANREIMNCGIRAARLLYRWYLDQKTENRSPREVLTP